MRRGDSDEGSHCGGCMEKKINVLRLKREFEKLGKDDLKEVPVFLRVRVCCLE